MKKAALLYFMYTIVFFLAAATRCNAQNRKAVDSLRKEINSHTTKDSSLVRIYLNYAESIVFENIDSAMKYTDDALQLSQTLKWQRGIASALNQKGMVYYYRSDLVSAMNYFQQALKAGESFHDKLLEATIYGNIAVIYADLGQSRKALGFYNKQLDISREAKNNKFETIALVNIGNVYLDENNYTKGLAYFKAGLTSAQEQSDLTKVSACLLNIGVIFKKQREYDSARIYLEEALDMSKKMDSRSIEADALGELAEVCVGLGYYNKAEKTSLQSVTLAKEVGDLEWERDAYKALGDAYEKEKKSDKALAAYKNYMGLKDSMLNDKTKDSITRLELQYGFNKTQDSIKAVTDKQQALDVAQIQKQRILKNTALAGTGFLFLAGMGGFALYKRNRDIRFKKQISDTELKALRAQIEPHFIGNSLTSINAFLIKNDTQKASEYLDKFSRLMRSILENSDQKEVSLVDDLNALEQYIQLEAVRMENNFTYEIQVADDIDKDNTLVQQLILQPFVENSIRHGLERMKNGNGKIIISIQKENNMLVCSVEDNGVGRKKVEAYKEQMSEKRKSFGMQITSDRIKIINKLKNTKASIQIFDLQQGTKVEVKLPLELSF